MLICPKPLVIIWLPSQKASQPQASQPQSDLDEAHQQATLSSIGGGLAHGRMHRGSSTTGTWEDAQGDVSCWCVFHPCARHRTHKFSPRVAKVPQSPHSSKTETNVRFHNSVLFTTASCQNLSTKFTVHPCFVGLITGYWLGIRLRNHVLHPLLDERIAHTPHVTTNRLEGQVRLL